MKGQQSVITTMKNMILVEFNCMYSLILRLNVLLQTHAPHGRASEPCASQARAPSSIRNSSTQDQGAARSENLAWVPSRRR
ncbi:hypothetical protein RSAG8_01258, partial [Rhizoctonia solani AG-8 WAC10335]